MVTDVEEHFVGGIAIASLLQKQKKYVGGALVVTQVSGLLSTID